MSNHAGDDGQNGPEDHSGSAGPAGPGGHGRTRSVRQFRMSGTERVGNAIFSTLTRAGGPVKLPVIFRSSSWLAVCGDGRFWPDAAKEHA